MKCPTCGADSTVSYEKLADDGMVVERARLCTNGHTHLTYEVVETVWSSAKNRHVAAVAAAVRRWARWGRDEKIRADLTAGVRTKAISRQWGLTRQSISAISQSKKTGT